MILVGEVEFTDFNFYPDGRSAFLFVGTFENKFQYSLSPYNEISAYSVGDNFISPISLSVTEFLQMVINADNAYGSIVFRSKDDVGVRLKGMTNWIKREK